ncbi:MAG: PKD domain-containing protein [Chloroflexota bacterium]
MDLSFNVSPVSGYVGITDFSFTPTGTSAAIPGAQYFWNFGDFGYVNTKEPQHIYSSPGRFTPTLQVTTPSREVFSVTGSVSASYLIQESISFERVPPPTLAGHYPLAPFRVRITSITPGEHWVDLYALYSRSTPEKIKASKWDFLEPQWRFLDLSGNKIDRIKTEDLPLYGANGIIGYTGTAEFYFIDDSYNIDQYLDGLPYSTILATLETSATRSFDPNRSTQNALPSFSNSLAQEVQPYIFYQRNPNKLKISENAIWDLTNPKWTAVKYPLVVSLTYQEDGTNTFIPYFSAGNLSHYHNFDSFSNATLSATSPVSGNLSVLLDSYGAVGFIKGTLNSTISSTSAQISAVATTTLSALSANWLPVAAWVSNPTLGTISKIQLLPTWLSADNPNINKAQVSDFYITKTPNSFAIESFPDNNTWAGNQEFSIIQKRDSKNTLLTSINLTSTINNSSVKLESIYLDSNKNLWVTLQPSTAVILISGTNISMGGSAANTATMYGGSPDVYNNFWSIGYKGNTGFITKYNNSGFYQSSAVLAVSSVPKGIVVDRNNKTWITMTSSNSSYILRLSAASIEQSITVPYSGIKFITVDDRQYPWFTCGTNVLGTYNTNTSALSYYNLSVSSFGGMQFLPPNILVLDNITNITHVVNLSGAETSKFRINPPGISFNIDDDGLTQTRYNSAAPSLSSIGDWTGWQWVNRYGTSISNYTTGTSTISLTGVSTMFDMLCSNPHSIYKKNESYDMASRIKELALLPAMQQSPVLFDEYLGGIFGQAPLQYQDLGVVAYEKISNWLNNTQNIDTCNINELYSLAQMVGLETDDYKLSYPEAIQRWMNLASISFNKLLGTPCHCQSVYTVKDSESNHICPLCGEYKPNNRGGLLTTSDILTAGQCVILNTRSLGDFRVVSLGEFNNQSTYSLSSWVSSMALGDNWSDYYEFYQFIPKSNNTMAQGIIDWKNTQTNLLSSNSSISAWMGDEQILDTIFSFELMNGLRLNNSDNLFDHAFLNMFGGIFLRPGSLYYYIFP